MHDAVPVRAIMRRSVGLLLLLAAGACGSTAQPGQDGGGGAGAGGTGGGAGAGGRGGGSGGAAGAPGGRGGGGGTGGCASNQVWCPGCDPGTGACYVGGCPGSACPPPDGGAAGASGSGGRGGTGGSAGTGGSVVCGGQVCTNGELCVRPSCGGTAPRCNPLPDGGQCPTGWTYKTFCNASPAPGPGCEEPPCTPPAPFCIARPASCGATVTCSCLPSNVCQFGGGCGFISGAEVLCQSA
jgi:hypothetical protein